MINKLKQYQLFENKEIEVFKFLENQGYCNENYLLKAENKKYLIRKFKLENDRKFEFQAQKLAHKNNIAAKPLILDEENGLMICEFLEGEHKNKLETQELGALARILLKLHRIELEKNPLRLDEVLNTRNKEIESAFSTLKTHKSEYVLCHNDLNPKNILFLNHGIKFIDWEFASVNDRYFDLAAVCVEFKLNLQEEACFLNAYFGNTLKVNKEKLNACKTLYRALVQEWFESRV